MEDTYARPTVDVPGICRLGPASHACLEFQLAVEDFEGREVNDEGFRGIGVRYRGSGSHTHPWTTTRSQALGSDGRWRL